VCIYVLFADGGHRAACSAHRRSHCLPHHRAVDILPDTDTHCGSRHAAAAATTSAAATTAAAGSTAGTAAYTGDLRVYAVREMIVAASGSWNVPLEKGGSSAD
jgi:hypothetical protein